MIINIQISAGSENFKQTYVLFETSAPRAYDYHGVIQVEGETKGTRIVAIPDEEREFQIPRYRSGMYGVTEVTEYTDEQTILDLIVSRLISSK